MKPPRPISSLRARIGLFLLGALAVALVSEVGTRVVVDEEEVLRWHDYSTQLKVEQLDRLVEEGRTPTVVIAGTSMAQQALIPGALANPSTTGTEGAESYYNAALNGGVPTVMERWLLDQVIPRTKPDRVLWGLASLDLSATYGDASDNAYSTAASTRPGRLANLDRWVSARSRFVASRAALRRPSAVFGSERREAEAKLAAARAELGPDGERRNFGLNTTTERSQELRQRIAPYAIDTEDLAAIVRTVDALQDQGIDVTFVELPVPPRLMELYPDGVNTHARFQSALGRLAEELGVSHHPLEAELSAYRDEDFVDFTHLTEAAAARFSRFVATR